MASMSGTASKEISQLLDGSLSKVSQLASETKSKAEAIALQNQEQMALTEQTASELNIVFDQIVGNNEQVKVMMSEVSTSINEYANGVKNIAEAMLSLDRVTQENADIASKVSENSATMRQQSLDLNVVVKDLEGEIFGADGHAIDITSAKSVESKPKKILKNPFASAKSAKTKPAVSKSPALPVKKPTIAKSATPVPAQKNSPKELKTEMPAPKSSPKILPLAKSQSKANHSPVAIKMVSGDSTGHAKTTDGLSVPSRTDRRFEDL